MSWVKGIVGALAWFKYLFGGILVVVGLFGLTTIFVGRVLPEFISGLGRLDLDVAPAVIFGILGFAVFMGGVYLMRS